MHTELNAAGCVNHIGHTPAKSPIDRLVEDIIGFKVVLIERIIGKMPPQRQRIEGMRIDAQASLQILIARYTGRFWADGFINGDAVLHEPFLQSSPIE